jgi:hypothetical protein
LIAFGVRRVISGKVRLPSVLLFNEGYLSAHAEHIPERADV